MQSNSLVQIELLSATKNLRFLAMLPNRRNYNVAFRINEPIQIPMTQEFGILNDKSETIIDLQKLSSDMSFQHHLHLQMYKFPSICGIRAEQVQIRVNFGKLNFSKSGIKYLDLFFERAQIEKDVNLFQKMDPHIKIKNQSWIWQGKPIQNGHKTPLFNQSISIPFAKINDKIVVDICNEKANIGHRICCIYDLMGKKQNNFLVLYDQKNMKIAINKLYFKAMNCFADYD